MSFSRRYMKLILLVFAAIGAVSSTAAAEGRKVEVTNNEQKPVPVTVQAGVATLAFFNDRLQPGQLVEFDVPDGFDLLITDIVIQNRSGGDAPVADREHSRVEIGDLINFTFFLTVVGNQTLHLGLTTGLLIPDGAGIRNIVSSTAPFFESIITGRFVPEAE